MRRKERPPSAAACARAKLANVLRSLNVAGVREAQLIPQLTELGERICHRTIFTRQPAPLLPCFRVEQEFHAWYANRLVSGRPGLAAYRNVPLVRVPGLRRSRGCLGRDHVVHLVADHRELGVVEEGQHGGLFRDVLDDLA